MTSVLHPQRNALLATVMFLLGLSLSGVMESAFAGDPPTCNGIQATIYVDSDTGLVVGGPNDGDEYIAGSTKIDGTSGDDVIVGTSEADIIRGRNGSDLICGLGGDDDIDGGIDSDTLCGGLGNDQISGGTDSDKLDGGAGTDSLDGDTNDDVCINGETTDACETFTTSTPFCLSDGDGDGVDDSLDVCPLISNPDQTDTDNDGIGNACETDDDNDGVEDSSDNCPLVSNADQADQNNDGEGDACDADIDGDGALNSADNCPFAANADQSDRDNDAIGDACDTEDNSATGGSGGGSGGSSNQDVGEKAITTVSAPHRTVSGSSGKGSRRGSNSVVLRATMKLALGKAVGISYIARRPTVELAIAPGAFGGGTGEFTVREKNVICTMQKSLNYQKLYLAHNGNFDGLKDETIDDLHLQIGRSKDEIRDALDDAELCNQDASNSSSDADIASAPGTYNAEDGIVRAFPVDGFGRPTSSNPVLKLCLINRLPLDRSGNPYNCGRFYSNSNSSKKWIMPDIGNIEFEWNPRVAGRTNAHLWLRIPPGYEPIVMTEENKDLFKYIGQVHKAILVKEKYSHLTQAMIKQQWQDYFKSNTNLLIQEGRTLQNVVKGMVAMQNTGNKLLVRNSENKSL